MNILTNGLVDVLAEEAAPSQTNGTVHAEKNGCNGTVHTPLMDMEFLRRCAWEIGETHATQAYTPSANHVGLAPVIPQQGFAHWRVLTRWVDHIAWQKGEAWRDCRLILRVYDVSLIEFNGFNAHHIQDFDLPGLCGQLFFKVPRPGAWQLAEVGFRLRNGEFVPAARSQSVAFPASAPSPHSNLAGLLIDSSGRIEEIGNVWDQDRIMRERRQPSLRRHLRIGAFAFASLATGQEGWLATFVSELAAGQSALGHETHVFVPASESFRASRPVSGVHFHPLDVRLEGPPLEQARAFGQAAEIVLGSLPPFDLIHFHEWMTGAGSAAGKTPTIRSVSSLESTRLGSVVPDDNSRAIAQAEHAAILAANYVLTPQWLLERARSELRLEDGRIRSFPMEGRLPNEWEAPLDFGQVKTGIGVGPVDRLILFVGPLEHAAGVDLLVEAVPVLLHRTPNLRVAFVGAGSMYGHLQHRAHQLGVAHAVRMLGHVDGPPLTRLVRSAEALVLPSRYRVPMDDCVVDLARRAGRAVVTTHAGPAHLVRHEETGVITYDNPGSMVWALDRVLSDPPHAERMGQNGMRREEAGIRWSEVARCYLDLCASLFPQLTVTRW
jgi:glycosyltransferase involved in cell wall biosynthesis